MIVAGSSGAAARLAVVALSAGFVSYTTANSFNTTCNKKGTTAGGGGGEAYPTGCQKNLSMFEVLLNGEVPCPCKVPKIPEGGRLMVKQMTQKPSLEVRGHFLPSLRDITGHYGPKFTCLIRDVREKWSVSTFFLIGL